MKIRRNKKYNVAERRIANEIYKLKGFNNKTRKSYLTNDDQVLILQLRNNRLRKSYKDREVKINALIKQLKGKYGEQS